MAENRPVAFFNWEVQRRSSELAGALGANYHQLLSDLPYGLRVLVLGCRTFGILLRDRPEIVFVQNPSMVLAALACVLRRVLGFQLVVDRHSNFKFHTRDSRALKYRMFHLLSRYTVRSADLTIVTNESLAGIVEDWGGRPFVLPDKLPRLDPSAGREWENPDVVVISSFGSDEPIPVVLKAARRLEGECTLYITGNSGKLSSELRESAPSNVKFTGFLEEEDYLSLLASCRIAVALTTQEHTLLCGAYESVSLGKPLVLSDTIDLRKYFGSAALYARNEEGDLEVKIREAIGSSRELEEVVLARRIEIHRNWRHAFEDLCINHLGLEPDPEITFPWNPA